MHETKRRSILKGITWRALATIDTILLSLLFTGNIGNALKIGGIEIITKLILFSVHERIWLRVKFGKNIFTNKEGKSEIYERHRRTIIKATSWRFFGSLDTFLIALVITGNIVQTASISVSEIFTKISLYWLHERIWQKISWGKII